MKTLFSVRTSQTSCIHEQEGEATSFQQLPEVSSSALRFSDMYESLQINTCEFIQSAILTNIWYRKPEIILSNLARSIDPHQYETAEKCSIFVENQQSDLVPNRNEGGVKIWESCYDLYSVLKASPPNRFMRNFLDLGCGQGLLGLYLSYIGDSKWKIDFQDFNLEVLKEATIPNSIFQYIHKKNAKILK